MAFFCCSWGLRAGGSFLNSSWYWDLVHSSYSSARVALNYRCWNDPPGWLAKSSTVDKPNPSDKVWNCSVQLHETEGQQWEWGYPGPFPVRAEGYLHYVYSQQLRAVHLLESHKYSSPAADWELGPEEFLQDKDWLPHLLPVWMKTSQSSQKNPTPQIRGLLP